MNSEKSNTKVIIVGNSCCLLENENGSKIDEFDVVIRFNGYKIKEYEKYVGSKIDISCFGIQGPSAVSDMIKRMYIKKNIQDSNKIWFPIFKAKARHQINFIKKMEIDSDNIGYITKEIKENLLSKFKKHGFIYKKGYGPTTGMYIIEKALDVFKNGEIYITGFDPGKKHKYSHYWTPKNTQYSHSTLKAENNLIKEYLENGTLKLL